MSGIDRREALKIFGLGLVTLGSGSVSSYLRRSGPPGGHSISEPRFGNSEPIENAAGAGRDSAPWGLLAPLTAGSALLDCRLVGMTGIVNGVATVDVQRSEGSRFQIRICRRDDSASAPRPVARSASYDFFLPNGGKGEKLTDEKDGLAVMALAAIVERNEPRQARLALDTLQEHWRRA